MRQLLTISLLFVFAISSQAQKNPQTTYPFIDANYLPNASAEMPSWASMLYQEEINDTKN